MRYQVYLAHHRRIQRSVERILCNQELKPPSFYESALPIRPQSGPSRSLRGKYKLKELHSRESLTTQSSECLFLGASSEPSSYGKKPISLFPCRQPSAHQGSEGSRFGLNCFSRRKQKFAEIDNKFFSTVAIRDSD